MNCTPDGEPSAASDPILSDDPIPRLTKDGSRTLYSARYGQTFGSSWGALAEARHVFLAGSGVEASLRRGLACRVLEVGFGSGLNFLLSADLAHAQGQAQPEAPLLEYLALDRTLPSLATLQALEYGRHLADAELFAAFLRFRARLPEAVPEGSYAFRWSCVRLELRVGEATRTLDVAALDAATTESVTAETTATLPEARRQRVYHTVYHDGFGPETNVELWDEAFLGKLHAALEPGGVLVSYTVQGALRRRLQILGFEVSKRPGPPGGKREMLVARKPV